MIQRWKLDTSTMIANLMNAITEKINNLKLAQATGASSLIWVRTLPVNVWDINATVSMNSDEGRWLVTFTPTIPGAWAQMSRDFNVNPPQYNDLIIAPYTDGDQNTSKWTVSIRSNWDQDFVVMVRFAFLANCPGSVSIRRLA